MMARYFSKKEDQVWAKNQRRRRKKGILSNERVERLDKFGFVWQVKKSKLKVLVKHLLPQTMVLQKRAFL
jgi:hypothetical protein